MQTTTIEDTKQAQLLRNMKAAMRAKPGMAADKEYGAPDLAQFTLLDEDLDYLPAPDLAIIAQDLISSCDELKHLRSSDYTITYLWKAEGGKSHGAPVYGKCQKASGLIAYLSEATWVIWLAADWVNTLYFTRRQVEALLFHELKHTAVTEDKYGNETPTTVGHDFEGFADEVKRFGAWDATLKTCQQSWEQLPLFDLSKVNRATGEILQ